MKHLVHLVSADVRRFRVLLAVWLLLQVTDAVFTGVRPGLFLDQSRMITVNLLETVLSLTRWLGLFVIVPLVVHTHPLVGGEAFWMTRPIPWQALFTSKILLLGTTLVAVPALCELVLMTACRVSAMEMVRVSLQTTLIGALWLVIVMALAAVTRNFTRFALTVCGVLAGIIAFLITVPAVLFRTIADAPQLSVVAARALVGPTPGTVILLLLITSALVQIVVQYRTRSWRLAVGAGVACFVAAIVGVLTWPWHESPLPVPEWAERDNALRLVAASPIAEFSRQPEDWQVVSARLKLSGIERGWLATLRLADGRVQFADGATLATAGNAYSGTVPFVSADDRPEQLVMRDVLGVARVWEGPERRRLDAMPAIVVSQADFKKYSGAAGTYRGRFLLDLDHVEVVAALPLRAGARYRDYWRRIVIDDVTAHPGSITLRTRQFSAASMFDSATPGRLSFYLRNRVTSEAVTGDSVESASAMAFGLPLAFHMSSESVSGFSATGNSIRFAGGDEDHGDAVVVSADWLDHAELIVVQTVSAGSVTRTVEIPHFEIRAARATSPG